MPTPPQLVQPAPPSPPNKFQFKPTRQPMLWAALAYAVGIIGGTDFSRPASWCIAATAAFLAAALYFLTRRKLLATILVFLTFFLAGVLQIQPRDSSAIRDSNLNPFAYGPPVQITAHVKREGRLR
ncbi:MAG: hypothetical protein WBX10_14495, partial [Candidatus Sulfotelmatobacter sp.]